MSYGFYTKNSSLGFQVDGKHSNMALTEQGSVTISGDTLININAAPEVPIITIRPETGKWVRVGGLNRNSNGNFNGFRITSELSDNGNYISTSVEWKCYRKVTQPSSEKYGLRVYNSSGDLVFDSGLSYFKIVQVNNLTKDDLPATINYSVDNPYFLITNFDLKMKSHQVANGQWFAEFYLVGINVQSANSVKVNLFHTYEHEIGGDEETTQMPDFKVLVCVS